MERARILMCGGDMRSIYMAGLFSTRGFDVSVCATDEELAEQYGLGVLEFSEGAGKADVIVLGLPAVKNDMSVNCPLCKEKLGFEKILKKADKGMVLAGGRFSAPARLMASDYGIKLIDYCSDEVFQIENAFYTAEGAIEAIIKNTVKSLSELKILVTGYGRISKALTRILASLGVKITVYARKKEQRAWAGMFGLDVTDKISALGAYDVIVNTAPAELFDDNMLKSVKKDALIVDLSARPGYVSRSLCEKNGVKLVFLPGLPAISAPRSAGEAAARAVIRMYNELTQGDGA